MRRIRLSDLEHQTKVINDYLQDLNANFRLVIARRYGYTAIDLTNPSGQIKNTLVSGLSKGEAFTILGVIRTILRELK